MSSNVFHTLTPTEYKSINIISAPSVFEYFDHQTECFKSDDNNLSWYCAVLIVMYCSRISGHYHSPHSSSCEGLGGAPNTVFPSIPFGSQF